MYQLGIKIRVWLFHNIMDLSLHSQIPYSKPTFGSWERRGEW